MKQAVPLVKKLWLPLTVTGVFIAASFYQEELVVKLGMTTAAQLRTIFPYALGIGIWMSLAYLLNSLLSIIVWEPLNRRVPVPRLLRDVAALIIYGLAITGIVGLVFDKPIVPLFAASGAGAIVIGLALRNVILDTFIGLALNFDRAFEIGDFIMVAGSPAGRVIELNWRTTRLLTNDGSILIIPNGKLGESIVTNLSRPEPVSQFEMSVFLDFELPTDRALRVLNAGVHSAVGRAGIIGEPAPYARINNVTPDGVEYKIKFYQDSRIAGTDGMPDDLLRAQSKAKHEVWRAVLDHLNHAGFGPATPKQDVFHAPQPQRQFDTHSHEDRVALLTRVELFESLTVMERTQLSTAMSERLFRQGEPVIELGDHGDSMFVLCEGLLEVRIALKEGQAAQRVARLQPGMFFGEMSVLTGEPRSASVVAVTDAVVFEISKETMAILVQSRPELAERIASTVTNRKLRNSEAAARANTTSLAAEKTSMTALLVGKILSFLGLKSKAGKPARQAAEPGPMFSEPIEETP